MTVEYVLQWTWFGRVVKQTYESCVDFVISEEKDSDSDRGVGQKILADDDFEA